MKPAEMRTNAEDLEEVAERAGAFDAHGRAGPCEVSGRGTIAGDSLEQVCSRGEINHIQPHSTNSVRNELDYVR